MKKAYIALLKLLLLPLCSHVILGTGPNASAAPSNKLKTANNRVGAMLSVLAVWKLGICSS